VTLADTTAASYLHSTSVSASSAAESTARRKENKNTELSHRNEVVPVAMELNDPFDQTTTSLHTELGRRILAVTSDMRKTS
jgi:hypothetical protein